MFTKIDLVLCSIILVEVATRERLEHRPTLGNELSRKVPDTNKNGTYLANTILKKKINAIGKNRNKRRNDSKFRDTYDDYYEDYGADNILRCWWMELHLFDDKVVEEKVTKCTMECSTILFCVQVQMKRQQLWPCSYMKMCTYENKDGVCSLLGEEIKKQAAIQEYKTLDFKCKILSCNTDLCNNEVFNSPAEIGKRLGVSRATQLKMINLLIFIPVLFFIF